MIKEANILSRHRDYMEMTSKSTFANKHGGKEGLKQFLNDKSNISSYLIFLLSDFMN